MTWAGPPGTMMKRPSRACWNWCRRDLNIRSPSFLFYAFDVNDPTDDKPLDTLGRINWTVLDKKTEETLDDGRRRESVSFEARTQGVIVTKTYTLTEGEYHVGLEVKMRARPERRARR